MRKPVVDYRKLRLSNITSPQYRHLLLLLGWVVYFCLYFLTENLIPVEDCYPVWCTLDDMIPFNEFFVIFYVGWYVLIVLSLGYFLLYSVESFKGLQTYIMVTQALAMICYIAFPTRQDLRPEEFPRENFLTWIMGIIYQFDTNTGVCPSLHVAYSVGIASAWLKEKSAAWYVKLIVTVFVVMVCLSVAFTKQHSVVDIFAAIPVCLVAEIFAFRNYYKARKKVKL
ncbi:MAG: phosphatidic acid phosphatase [Oscillospiraceae bacterium]|nr:phosphatidic acid phosphatase [Oscillospiraceae bacterium]